MLGAAGPGALAALAADYRKGLLLWQDEVNSRGGLLGRTEPWAGEAVAASLRKLGVDVRLGVATDSVEALPDGGVRLTLSATGHAAEGEAPDVAPVTAERVLVVMGSASGAAGEAVDEGGRRGLRRGAPGRHRPDFAE